MFSGLLRIVDGKFEQAQTTTMLMNDLWSFDVDHVSEFVTDRNWLASRVAGCGRDVDFTNIVQTSTQDQPSAGLRSDKAVWYPGPRFSGATWVHKQRGWLFGGIGRRVTLYDGFGGEGGNCHADSILTFAGQTPVTNLCDVWQFTPGEGFRLVAACTRDLPELNAAGLSPSTIVPMADGPTAGVLTTTWVVGTKQPGAGSLWMFGGLTLCDGFDGVDTLPRLYRPETYSSEDIQNLTTCDLVSGKGEELTQQVASVGSNFPNQPCTADLWRFDLGTENWVKHHQPTVSDAWPSGRCGAMVHAAMPAPSQGATHAGLLGATAAVLGGWAGSGGGECERWPLCASSPGSAETPVPKRALAEQPVGACSGENSVFKSFELSEVASVVSRYDRMGAAACMPLVEALQLDLRDAQ